MAKGDFKGATAVLDEAVKDKKDLPDVYRMRSSLRGMFGNFSGALSDLSAAIEIKPDDAQFYEQRALLRMNLQQDSTLILKDLDSAIAFGRRIETVYSLRATLRRNTGDNAGAMADYQAAIGLRPDFAQAYNGLASLFEIDGDDQKAAAVLESFVNIYETSAAKKSGINVTGIGAGKPIEIPTDSSDRFQKVQGAMIVIESKEGQSPKSPEQLAKLSDDVGQTMNTALIYSKLASIYFDNKDYNRAAKTVEKAFAVYPNDFTAFQLRGKLRMQASDYKGAIKDFDTALKIMPGLPEVYLERGIALLSSGRDAEAKNDFDRYLQIYPQSKESVEKRIAEAKQRMPQNADKP